MNDTMLKQIAAPKTIVKTTKYVFSNNNCSDDLLTVPSARDWFVCAGSELLLFFGQQLEYLPALCLVGRFINSPSITLEVPLINKPLHGITPLG
jgi:hypothetical protein